MKPPPAHEAISASCINDVCARFAENKPVRQALPGGGTLNIDRKLPFLCIYRRNPARRDEGTGLFVTAEASFVHAPGDAPIRKGLQQLVRRLASTASQEFGGFLLLEVWIGDERNLPRDRDPESGELMLPPPAFRVLTRHQHNPQGSVAALEFALQQIKVHRQKADVEIVLQARNHPPGMTQLIPEATAQQINCHIVGLEVRPIYREPRSGEVYNDVLQALRRGISRGLKKAFFAYALNRTNYRPLHFYALGRKSLPQQVWNVDRKLSEVSSQFKFLLLCSPINAERSRREFMESGQRVAPVFQYRPLTGDPLLLKRRLMNVATEQIVDPAISYVLRQTQDELDRQITMLSDIGSRNFLPGSLQVFGRVEPSLFQLAEEILRQLPGSQPDPTETETVGARAFARLAAREIAYYRKQWPGFTARAIVQDDMYSGLLATGGNLLIGRETNIAASRVDALLQHEIGTHLVTYYNGQAQPLRLLKVGLAGYDGLQEGLAVLSEYLVGGLSRSRMRTLAARVVATDQLIRGAKFTDVYVQLKDNYGFEPRVAYTITLRVFRGGGLTKDAAYLRGLAEILQFVAKGNDIEPLFVGKIASDHVSIVRELLLRGVLVKPLLRPHYLDNSAAVCRLQQLKAGCTVLDLLNH